MMIKEITVINIMHGTLGDHKVYIKHQDLKEMVEADALHDLPDFLDMMFKARTNPGLQDCLDRAKMFYRLGKT